MIRADHERRFFPFFFFFNDTATTEIYTLSLHDALPISSIPFFTGYAVEIGHLIDAAERVGIEGLGQVDLERRVHRNQELEGLSRMSFVILQAVMKRLEERRKARLFAELGSTMK